MKKALSIYQYAAPAILAPLSLLLWRREYGGNMRLALCAWLLPILWAYIVPGIGTNVLKVWEFDTRLRLGRFRPHHGFVFGSATAMLAWLVHGTPWNALLLCALLTLCNLAYDVLALQSGILHVYNQPWSEGKSEVEIALDYAPWFFGGFGAVYGAGIGILERLNGDAVAFVIVLLLSLLLPTAGYVCWSKWRHGHWGTRPVTKNAIANTELRIEN
jgi:hypothetical protein